MAKRKKGVLGRIADSITGGGGQKVGEFKKDMSKDNPTNVVAAADMLTKKKKKREQMLKEASTY